MHSIKAETILEAVYKMRSFDKTANVCLLSPGGQMVLEQECRARVPTAENPKLDSFYGLEIVSSTDVEGDECFFFSQKEDALEFLEIIRQLKRAGVTWVQTVNLFRDKLGMVI